VEGTLTLNTPFISFVIPVRNGEKTLGACLDSIFSLQTNLAFEVIVVDNASTDQSAHVAQMKGAQVVREPRVGRSWARNKGVESSRGEWVAFVDADVELHKLWLSEIVGAIIEPGLDGGQGPIIPSSHQGPSLFERYRYESRALQSMGSFCHLHEDFPDLPMINSAACLYRKSALEKVGGFDVALNGHEDKDLAWRVHLAGYTLASAYGAISYVYWDRGGFFSYLKRAWFMGVEYVHFQELWGLPFFFETPAPHVELKDPFLRLMDWSYKFIYFCAVYLHLNHHSPRAGAGPVGQERFLRLKNRKIPIDDGLIFIPGEVLWIWCEKLLVIKNTKINKKITIPNLSNQRVFSHFVRLILDHSQELNNLGVEIFHKASTELLKLKKSTEA
jgi:glycosyltransferase involved in cell wall biosynthesis